MPRLKYSIVGLVASLVLSVTTFGKGVNLSMSYRTSVYSREEISVVRERFTAAVRGLGEIFHRRGSLSEALALYERALAIARNDPDLQQTVADLKRELAKRPARATEDVPQGEPSGLLTLEQLAQELQRQIPLAPPAPARTAPIVQASRVEAISVTNPPPGPVVAASAGSGRDPSGRDADLRAIATLGRWLNAIDGIRAERRA